MNSEIGRCEARRTRRERIAAVCLSLLIYMGASATAHALQVLEASDHAELIAEISATDVNRIALDGDRISRVIQSPGGFSVEHDPVRGDLYLHPDAAAVFAPARDNVSAPARASAPVTLYLGTEQGFTYRLSLSVVSRDSAQILIRNAAIAVGPLDRTRSVDGDRRGELVSLILAVARREPVRDYVIVPAPATSTSPGRDSLVEYWQGPRFTAQVLRTTAEGVEDAAQLARLSGSAVVAAWLSPPGRGPNGERIAVLVENNDRAEPVR